ncbi:hypothetical protein N7478_002050 [Penicillium angulare]|uniref:uncharacterized protein n=1 Tax=Penicillium angulare TaxID=116970 RepID=UPI0025411F64|nr:uncharacterized protein N7478_002050 [Penicillium angulare]KAJ5289020.1 hypothetical protein N7478_002050 [Penicillium angulare]
MRFFTILALGLAGAAAALPAGSGTVTPTPTSSAVASGTVAPSTTASPALPSPKARLDPNAPVPVQHLQNTYYQDYHSWERETGEQKEKLYKQCQKDLNNLGRAEATHAISPDATPTPSLPAKRTY